MKETKYGTVLPSPTATLSSTWHVCFLWIPIYTCFPFPRILHMFFVLFCLLFCSDFVLFACKRLLELRKDLKLILLCSNTTNFGIFEVYFNGCVTISLPAIPDHSVHSIPLEDIIQMTAWKVSLLARGICPKPIVLKLNYFLNSYDESHYINSEE